MATLISIALCLGLGLIAYQDFRYRAVHVFVLIAVFGLQIAAGITIAGYRDFLLNWGMNMVLLLMQLVLLILFWLVKHRTLSNLIDQSLGKGDVLFFIILSASFSSLNFMLFFVASLILTLALALIFYRNRLIPLAGWLALFYLLTIVCSFMLPFACYTNIFNL